MSSSSPHSRGTLQRSATLADLRHAAEVREAYDTVALEGPDLARRAQEGHPLAREGMWMRSVLWRHYGRIFGPRDRILDVGCGIGSDTLYLAELGLRMTGLDLSARMAARLETEARRRGREISDLVQIRVAETADLSTWPGHYFHGIVSSFGTLNTVWNVGGFAVQAARLLLPRGRLVFHVLAPGDFWERRRRFSLEGRQEALRYFHRRHRTKRIAGLPVRHRVISSSEIYHRYFEPHFHLRQRYGLGFLAPEHVMRKLPARIAGLIGRLEAAAGGLRPFLLRSRFVVLDLESRISKI